MKAQGSIAEFDFPALVQDLSERRWTGTLHLVNAGVGKSATLQEGRLVFAASTSPDDRMGALLLRRGRITLRQLADASLTVGPGKRLGAVLVEMGVLTPKDLIAAVVEHTLEILYGAFAWTEGQYRLQEGAAPSESIMLRISTPDVIFEGIRRIDSWTRIDRAVGGLAAVYERAPGQEAAIRRLRPTAERAALLARLERPATVEALCGMPGFPDFEVCRTLWAFRVIGLIRRLDAAAPVPPELADEGLGIFVFEE